MPVNAEAVAEAKKLLKNDKYQKFILELLEMEKKLNSVIGASQTQVVIPPVTAASQNQTENDMEEWVIVEKLHLLDQMINRELSVFSYNLYRNISNNGCDIRSGVIIKDLNVNGILAISGVAESILKFKNLMNLKVNPAGTYDHHIQYIKNIKKSIENINEIISAIDDAKYPSTKKYFEAELDKIKIDLKKMLAGETDLNNDFLLNTENAVTKLKKNLDKCNLNDQSPLISIEAKIEEINKNISKIDVISNSRVVPYFKKELDKIKTDLEKMLKGEMDLKGFQDDFAKKVAGLEDELNFFNKENCDDQAKLIVASYASLISEIVKAEEQYKNYPLTMAEIQTKKENLNILYHQTLKATTRPNHTEFFNSIQQYQGSINFFLHSNPADREKEFAKALAADKATKSKAPENAQQNPSQQSQADIMSVALAKFTKEEFSLLSNDENVNKCLKGATSGSYQKVLFNKTEFDQLNSAIGNSNDRNIKTLSEKLVQSKVAAEIEKIDDRIDRLKKSIIASTIQKEELSELTPVYRELETLDVKKKALMSKFNPSAETLASSTTEANPAASARTALQQIMTPSPDSDHDAPAPRGHCVR